MIDKNTEGKEIHMDLALDLFLKLLQVTANFTNISKHMVFYFTINFENTDFSYQGKAQ